MLSRPEDEIRRGCLVDSPAGALSSTAAEYNKQYKLGSRAESLATKVGDTRKQTH